MRPTARKPVSRTNNDSILASHVFRRKNVIFAEY